MVKGDWKTARNVNRERTFLDAITRGAIRCVILLVRIQLTVPIYKTILWVLIPDMACACACVHVTNLVAGINGTEML